MSKKIDRLEDYIGARDAALILSLKHGRPIQPSYIHKVRSLRFVILNATTKLYHKADVEACTIRKKGA